MFMALLLKGFSSTGRPATIHAKHFILKVIWRNSPNPGDPVLFAA
jgi:hypothetical protein